MPLRDLSTGVGDSSVPLKSIIQTAELEQRPSRPPDYEAENRALVALAQALADSPRTILQTLAETAMELCGAGSGGISLLTEEDGGRNFYWPAVVGEWAQHVGGGTPRDFGPCGVVLDTDAVQLFSRPERFYPYLAAVSPPIEEALLTPFHVKATAVGTLWVIAHDQRRRFDREDMRQLVSLGTFASAAYQAWKSIDRTERQTEALRESEEQLAIELAAMQQLQETSIQLIREDDVEALYERILDAAVGIMRSDMASMQIVDEDQDALRMLAWRGFEPVFGNVFALNRPDTKTSCSVARRLCQRVIVPDVETCDFIVGTTALDDHRRTGIRAVQSTPLVSRSGRLLGIISTHWRQPHKPSERDLRLLDLLARQAADLLERTQAETAVRESEAQLRRARRILEEAVHAREEFLLMASHELRNPVNALQLQLVALLRALHENDGPIAPQWASHRIGQAVAAVRRLVRLVETLLDLSQITTGRLDLEPEEMDFAQSVHAVIERFNEQLQDRQVSIRTAPVTGSWDRLRLEQIVTNLVSNAIKYGAGLPIEVSLEADDGTVCLSVTDHGIGIEPENQKRLFKRFERAVSRRHYGGFGLGLWITQQIVHAMGGEIAVESRPGEGSTFRVKLPRNLAAGAERLAERAANAQSDENVAGSRKDETDPRGGRR